MHPIDQRTRALDQRDRLVAQTLPVRIYGDHFPVGPLVDYRRDFGGSFDRPNGIVLSGIVVVNGIVVTGVVVVNGIVVTGGKDRRRYLVEEILARGVEFLDAFAGGCDLRVTLGLERVGNGNLLGFAGLLLDGRDVQDTIDVQTHPAHHLVGGVDVPQARDLEVAHQYVLQSVFIVALENLDVHPGLPGEAGVVALGAGDRQRSVAVNDGVVAMRIGHAATLAQVRRAERIGRDVHQHPLDVAARQARGQHAGAQGYAQVGMHVLPGLQAGALSQKARNQR